MRSRVLPALIAGLGLILACQATAQTFTTLHRFSFGDGATPYAGLILSSNTLFGMSYYGGPSDNGTVYSLSLGQ